MTNIANLAHWAVTQGYDPKVDYTPKPSLPAGYVSPHFRQTEFACRHCGLYPNTPTPPSQVLDWLENIREHFDGRPVNVNSGYRCPVHNANVGGAKNSYHLQGRAVDFWIRDVPPVDVYAYADQLIGDKGGVGKYNTFTHIDDRGIRRRW